MADFTIPHRCKGSLAIAEETIEACWDDPATATHVLIFAAVLASLKAGIPIGEVARLALMHNDPARCLLGMDEHAIRGMN